MKQLCREPKEKNKYNLDSKKIRNLKIINRERLIDFGFWRNNVISGWCFSAEIGDNTCCSDNSFWICVYDKEIRNLEGRKKDVKRKLKNANSVDFYFAVYGSNIYIEIEKFYNYKDIKNENDLVIQEMFMSKINELIDNNILEIL